MKFNVNGMEVEAVYNNDVINTVFYPLLHHLTALQKQLDRRIIVYMAAPPGCGKTTLSLYLDYLSRQDTSLTPLQALGMDGFHHTNAYLNTHYRTGTSDLLALHKGAPDTFNIESLKQHILDIKNGKPCLWPIYDRQLHDPVDNAIEVKEKIILIEGNYLLLDQPGWNELVHCCDYSIFIGSQPIYLENRLIQRKARSNSNATLDSAIIHYHETDKPNILLVMKEQLPADLTLELIQNNLGELILQKR